MIGDDLKVGVIIFSDLGGIERAGKFSIPRTLGADDQMRSVRKRHKEVKICSAHKSSYWWCGSGGVEHVGCDIEAEASTVYECPFKSDDNLQRLFGRSHFHKAVAG